MTFGNWDSESGTVELDGLYGKIAKIRGVVLAIRKALKDEKTHALT